MRFLKLFIAIAFIAAIIFAKLQDYNRNNLPKYQFLSIPYLCNELENDGYPILKDCVNINSNEKIDEVLNPINIVKIKE